METTTLKLINADELGMYAPAKASFNIPTTVMSGKLKAQVTELNKTDKKEQADAIKKSQTFTIHLDFTKMPISQILKLVSNPQSVIVSLQNGLLRPLGDDKLKAIAKGDEIEIPFADNVKFHAKNKVVYITVKSWIGRPKTANGLTPLEKTEREFGKLDEDSQVEFLAKKMMAKNPDLKLEDAISQVKALI